MRKPRGKTSAGRKAAPGMPSREQVLEFLAENPGVTGKREIARAFGLTGSDKIALKALLKEIESLADDPSESPLSALPVLPGRS